MDTSREDDISYTTQHQEEFLMYVENKSCARSRCFPIVISESVPSNNHISSIMDCRSGQSSYDPYDLSSKDDEYSRPESVAEMTPGRSNHAERSLTARSLYLNTLAGLPQYWGQVNPNLSDFHSDPKEISSSLKILHIANWWHQQEELHSKSTNLSNVACDMFSVIPHGVGSENSFSLVGDIIGWRQSKTTGKTIHEKVVV